MRTINKILTMTAMAAFLQACGGGQIGDDIKADAPVTSSKVVFDPSLGADGVPFPIDLLFATTVDGSINIPGKANSIDSAKLLTALATSDGGADEGALIAAAATTPNAAYLADPQTALNTMDGFSTTAPMVVRFSDAISSDNLSTNVRLFALTSFDPGAAGTLTVDSELTWGVDFVAGVSGGTSLLIQPLRPLTPHTTYVVVIQNGITTTAGNAVSQDGTYALLNGSFQLSLAVPSLGTKPDFIVEASGSASCDFTSLASIADCTKINPAYASAPPAAAISAQLNALEQQAIASGDYSSIWQLEQLRRITFKQLTAVAGASSPVDPTQVALSYSVSTEDIGTAISQAEAQVDAASTPPSITVLNPLSSWDGAGTGLPWEITSPGADGDVSTPADASAYIYLGTLNDMLEFVDPTNPNASVWQADNSSWLGGSVPACTALYASAVGGSKNLVACNQYTPSPVTTTYSAPVIISAPNATLLGSTCASLAGGSGLPVVIYQHGITSNRGTIMAIADTLASQCIVGIGIDMPKHGISPSDPLFKDLNSLQQAFQQPPFTASANPSPVIERLVKVASPATDCLAGTGTATGIDTDYYCPSGDNYVNLSNLANSRDSLRQSVVDLHTLYKALSDIHGPAGQTIAQSIGAPIDTNDVSFVGISLGSIVGAPFVSNHTSLKSAVLNVGGGGIAKILDGSPTFEPVVTAGLYDAGGISKPGGDYEGFLIIAQSMVDNTDPINFAEDLAGGGVPVLAQEVIGDPTNSTACILSGTGCPDQVVPNNVFGASFGPAWGLVSGSGQSGFLANQNFVTTPVALAGTDAFAQGTGFVAIAAAYQAGAPIDPAALGPLAADAVVSPAVSFKGAGLKSVGACGTLGNSGIVRYTAGTHSSLLDPGSTALSLAVTTLMQKQMVGFVASSGGVISGDDSGMSLVADHTSASSAACP